MRRVRLRVGARGSQPREHRPRLRLFLLLLRRLRARKGRSRAARRAVGNSGGCLLRRASRIRTAREPRPIEPSAAP
eukprot:scaffold21991_cov33-Tisochrysis_lutea.AAC.7